MLRTTALFLLIAFSLPAQDSPDTAQRPTKNFRKRIVASGLDGPWEVTWGPDNHLWVTERTGKRVTRIHPETGKATVAVTIPEVSAPGGQDGLLGLALHPGLGKGTGSDFVYVAYTYVDKAKGADPTIADPASPYRYLYGKIVRFTYNASSGTLTNPADVLTGLPAGNDHNGGRLKFGPDNKLYLTIGDQGNNQLGNYCLPVHSQRIPTRLELEAKEYSSYVGKSLRINLDGSIPADNPRINGVVSHVYTYGHRNPQGLDFAPDGTLYSSEHGPKTDDEVNVLKAGGNYGWPNVAGFRDGKAYEYARWAESTAPCSAIKFSDLEIHASVPRQPESAFKARMQNPLATLFTVNSGFNFQDPACKGIHFICWPTVGVSGIEHYSNQGGGIPGWDRVLLAPALKRGSLYVIPLKANGQAKAGYISRYFHSDNRFRDTAVSPDGKTIFVATDPGGLAESLAGGTTTTMQDPGAILAFTYVGEGTGEVIADPAQVSAVRPATGQMSGHILTDGIAPQFTAAQAAAGRTAYNASCAVCHGSTMTNGTFGTPLGGKYFKDKWSGRSVKALLDKSQKTMPPAAPDSLKASIYADIVAYILETNGVKAGTATLTPGDASVDAMRIP
jgi:PQQ-dependent dehydrogenase (s-GDH family)